MGGFRGGLLVRMHDAAAEVHAQSAPFSPKLLKGTYALVYVPTPQGKDTVFLFYLEMI